MNMVKLDSGRIMFGATLLQLEAEWKACLSRNIEGSETVSYNEGMKFDYDKDLGNQMFKNLK